MKNHLADECFSFYIVCLLIVALTVREVNFVCPSVQLSETFFCVEKRKEA